MPEANPKKKMHSLNLEEATTKLVVQSLEIQMFCASSLKV
jgi:hypothetical protein